MHHATEEHMVPEKYLPKNTDPDQPNPDLATINYVRTKQGLPSFWSVY
jgi:hypothetical protein